MQIDNNEETNLKMPATIAEETSQEKGSQYVEETVIQMEMTTPDQEGHQQTNARGRYTVISAELRERICSLSLQGNNLSYISHILNLKRQTVASIIKRFELTGQSQSARKGGDTRSKLLDTQKALIRHWVDNDCLLTLKQLVDKVHKEFVITVSKSCVDKVLNDFHYTLKKADLIPEARNYRSTIESRFTYSQNYRRLELEYPIESFIFIDEIGFSVSLRPKKGRALKGE